MLAVCVPGTLNPVGGVMSCFSGNFFAAAVEAMRRILVNHARNRLKRSGDRARLEAKASIAAIVAHVIPFGGLSVEEVGQALDLSRPVAYRNWMYALAWLQGAQVE